MKGCIAFRKCQLKSCAKGFTGIFMTFFTVIFSPGKKKFQDRKKLQINAPEKILSCFFDPPVGIYQIFITQSPRRPDQACVAK